MSYPLSFLKHPFLPATEKPRFFNSRRKPFLLPQQKTHGFAKKICSRNRKTMVFELSSVARLTPEGPGGEAPVYELGKAMDWGPDTLFPQRSRNSPATQLGGGAPMAPHGAIFHETFSAIEWHMAAIYTLRERLGMARVVGWSDSTHAWKDHENHWKTMRTIGRP